MTGANRRKTKSKPGGISLVLRHYERYPMCQLGHYAQIPLLNYSKKVEKGRKLLTKRLDKLYNKSLK